MTLAGQPAFTPPSPSTAAPFGLLLGRPIVICEHCRALGQTGDVIFADLRQYLALTKAGGLETASSIHLWFDYDVTAFRFTFRIDGQPWLSQPISPAHGSTSMSPFVALAKRE
jgi:HK97 family phage major capsid protein